MLFAREIEFWLELMIVLGDKILLLKVSENDPLKASMTAFSC